MYSSKLLCAEKPKEAQTIQIDSSNQVRFTLFAVAVGIAFDVALYFSIEDVLQVMATVILHFPLRMNVGSNCRHNVIYLQCDIHLEFQPKVRANSTSWPVDLKLFEYTNEFAISNGCRLTS